MTKGRIADTFNDPEPKPIERDKLVPDDWIDLTPPCTCRKLGGAPRGHNHHPNCDIWR